MGLTYYYKFQAPAETPAHRLEEFLRSVEAKARHLKFQPTLVVNATFDSPERRGFARRLVSGFNVADERLITDALPLQTIVWNHDPSKGFVRLIPTAGVFLVVTDEDGCETFFGFFKYPEFVHDNDGRIVAEPELGGSWFFEDWIKTPDPRFREIVKEFAKAGFLAEQKDDYRQG